MFSSVYRVCLERPLFFLHNLMYLVGLEHCMPILLASLIIFLIFPSLALSSESLGLPLTIFSSPGKTKKSYASRGKIYLLENELTMARLAK